MPLPDLPDRIYHLALRDEWLEAQASALYQGSTLGRSIADEGFVHCSFRDQVQSIADLVYHGRGDVVLLQIDPSRVRADVRLEDLEGRGQLFPHVYGPLPVEAVVKASDVPLGPDGRLEVEHLLATS